MRLRRRKPGSGIAFDRLAGFLPHDAVIVEAGAASGHDAVRLAKLFPGGQIHAFEPEPATFELLQERVRGLPNVTCWPVALGPTDRDTVLHVSDGPYGTTSSSLLTPKDHLIEMPDVTFDTDITVRQQTITAWAKQAGVERVDAFTLDMQGMEHAALAASANLVEEATVVVSEVFLNEKFVGCGTVTDLQRLLAELGFVVVETNMFWRNSGDLLAVNARWFR